MNVQAMIDTLRAAREEALETAARCADAIALFEGHGVVARKPAAKPKPTAKAKLARASKKAKAPAKAAKSLKAPTKAKVEDDEPRARKGHVPRVGVQQLYCATLRERQVATGRLKGDGYRRIGPGEPLTAGTYDVRPSGDEDETCVVLWRAKAEPAEASA